MLAGQLTMVEFHMSTNNCRNCGSSDRYSRELKVGGTYFAGLLPLGTRMFGNL